MIFFVSLYLYIHTTYIHGQICCTPSFPRYSPSMSDLFFVYDCCYLSLLVLSFFRKVISRKNTTLQSDPPPHQPTNGWPQESPNPTTQQPTLAMTAVPHGVFRHLLGMDARRLGDGKMAATTAIARSIQQQQTHPQLRPQEQVLTVTSRNQPNQE